MSSPDRGSSRRSTLRFAGQSPAHLDEAEDAERQRRHGRLFHSGEPQQLQQLLHPLVLLRGRREQANGDRACRAQSRVGATRARCAKTRCSRTVSPMNSSGCWNVRANPFLALARQEALVTSSPCRCTRPPLGRRRPDRTARSVDFPAPFGPTSPAMLPGWTSRLTPESAVEPAEADGDVVRRQAQVHLRQHGSGACISLGATITRCAPPRESSGPVPRRRRQGPGRRPRHPPAAAAHGGPTVAAGDSARPERRRDTWPPRRRRARTARA